LVVEFGLRGIPCRQQSRFPVIYKPIEVGEYVPDLKSFREIIIETRTIDRITDLKRGQVINYQKYLNFA